MAIKAGSGISGTIDIRGAEELAAALQELGKAMEKKILRSAMRQAATIILEDAKRRAPVLTGQLRKSLRIRAIKRTRKGQVGVVISTSKGFFKGDDFYGGFHEFGTKKMPARPFIRPAFEANKSKAITIITEAIKLGLRDAANGASKLTKLKSVRPDLFEPGTP